MKQALLLLAVFCLALPAYAQSTLYTNSSSVGIGTTSPAVSLDASQKTDALALPVGTSGQRPTGANGMIRLNSDTPAVEAYYGGAWNTLGAGGTGFTSCTHVSILNTAAPLSVSCAGGYTMTGGGCNNMGNITQSYPSAANTWTCNGTNASGDAYVICCH